MSHVKYRKNAIKDEPTKLLKRKLTAFLKKYSEVGNFQIYMELTGHEVDDSRSVQYYIMDFMKAAQKSIQQAYDGYWSDNEPMWMSDGEFKRIEAIKELQDIKHKYITNGKYNQ